MLQAREELEKLEELSRARSELAFGAALVCLRLHPRPDYKANQHLPLFTFECRTACMHIVLSSFTGACGGCGLVAK